MWIVLLSRRKILVGKRSTVKGVDSGHPYWVVVGREKESRECEATAQNVFVQDQAVRCREG